MCPDLLTKTHEHKPMNTRIGLRAIGLLMTAVILQSCAHGPLQTEQVNVQQTPAQWLVSHKSAGADIQLEQPAQDSQDSVNRVEGNPAGRTVLWGGVVVSSENLPEGTQLEILSYPLDHLQRPVQSDSATGRFLALHPDYLETIDYAAGRLVTITGVINGVDTGKVGNADYSYVQVSVDQIYLWSTSGEDHLPAFTFGIGISISN